MNSSAKLHIREWQKSDAAVFELHGWLPDKGLAFVVNPEKRRQVIRFVLPGLLAHGGMGLGVAFPRTAPATITETCLLPPPCRTTVEEAECLRAAAAEARSPRSTMKSRNASDLPNWELVWLRHRKEVLLPAPEDRNALAERLEVFKAKMRQEYEARRQELEEWRTKTIGQMIYLGGGRYYRELRHCKPASRPERGGGPFYSKRHESKPTSMSEQIERHMSLLETSFTRPLSEFLGRLHGGYLNWTVEVARHEPIIRDPVLHERWATQQHVKLAEINADKEAFLNWYRPHCPAPMRRASNDFLEVAFPGASVAIADNALCAEVRFVADFPDGSRVWLADCPRRDPLLTAEEQRPFEAPGPLSTPIGQSLDSIATRAEHVSATLAAAGENLTKAGQQARTDAEAGAATIAAAGDHVETKSQAAAQTLRQARKDLQPTLDELETNQARLEAVVEEYKLKESPVQTRRALANHGVSKRIIDFILKHLMLGNPVPKAPTAALQLQNKYATKDGLDRKTVDRHYHKALPILRAAGWPEHLMPTSNAADPSEESKAGKKPQGDKPAEPTVTSANGVEPDSNESLTAFERIQHQEHGSADQP